MKRSVPDVPRASSREELTALYRDLTSHNLVVGNSGNVSARTDFGMLITLTGASSKTVCPDTLIEMTFDGRFDGDMLPSSEWEMHAAIYRAAPEAMVIVHTHSDHATALACLNRSLPAFHYGVLEFGGEEVRCAGYATFGTADLARLVAEAMVGRTACLLANHGMICHGRDTHGALNAALKLDTLARQYLVACAAGMPRLLTPEEILAARERYRTYGQQTVSIDGLGRQL